MKQIIQDMKSGRTVLEEVPVPQVKSGYVLVKTSCSLVSLGTERMLVEFGKANLIDKARQQPDKVKQVLDKIKTDGLQPTLEAVFNKLGQPLPLGYCNSGIVVAVGNGVTEFKVGDRVASNGQHAEYVCVPKNLVAKIPENVSDEEAAFTVIGSIGLQGIRLLNPQLGETVVVIGLGLIGLITAQLLKANGCKVIGVDFDEEKVELARTKGADFSHNLLLESNQLLDLLVTGENRAEHVRLADLLRARLDHQHGFIRTGDRQAQLGNRALLLIRIDDDFTIDQTDGNAADRARPRDIADRNRGGSADHRGNIRRHVLLNGKHRRHNLHVVAHALVEQRAQRAVDQAGGQRRLFRRTTLALDETAGDLAHGIHLLFKVNAQREKVLTLARRVARRRVDHDHRVAQADDHRSVSLTAVLAKFHNQRTPRQLCGIRLDHRVESPFKIPACQHFFSDANPRRLIYKTDFSIRFRFIKNEKGRRLGRQKLSPKRRSSGTKPFS